MYPISTSFKHYEFPTLAAALASQQAFGYGTIITIKGDTTRFKLGQGQFVSFDTPPNPTAPTFSQLPWINAQASIANAVAINASATLTAAQLAAKYITSTSAAATTITLPTASQLATQLSANQGTELSFVVDNTAGASVVTLAVNTGITVGTPALTGENSLTVPAGQVAKFTLFFTSATAALLYRVL